MDDSLLPCVEIEPGAGALCAVLWLHGLGADGHDFEPIVPELGLDPALRVRFVFPHAPSIPVTLNGGMVMPAWYDIAGPDLRRGEDLEGVRRSAAELGRLVDREVERGIPRERIVVAGFSQGGAVALFHGLRRAEPLAGIVGLSCYLPGGEVSLTESTAARTTPIFLAHGQYDPMVPLPRGEETRRLLVLRGFTPVWRTYPIMHSVCLEEIRDLGRWLEEVLAGDREAAGPSPA
jgi:phospholipase/carboxylesterase